MANVLLIAEHDGKTLAPSTAKTIACAATLTVLSVLSSLGLF